MVCLYIVYRYIDIYMVVCSVCRVHVGHVCTSVWCGVGMRYGRGSVYECGCIYIMYIDLYSLIAGSWEKGLRHPESLREFSKYLWTAASS